MPSDPQSIRIPPYVYWLGIPIGILVGALAISAASKPRLVPEKPQIRHADNPNRNPVTPDPALIEEKKREWTAAGYSPEMQERAIDWAIGWSEGIARKLKLPPEYAARIFPEALDMATRWLEGFTTFTRSI
jgi:hypothetical protein